jgi:hypothetical protein
LLPRAGPRRYARAVPGPGDIPGVAVPAGESAAAPPSRRRVWPLWCLATVLLTGGGWMAADAAIVGAARARAASRWDALRLCLVGDGVAPGRPSERLRAIRLAVAETPTDWPKRCSAYAEALDAALASRSLREKLGRVPSAVNIVADVANRGGELDALHEALEAADLPLPAHAAEVTPAPTPARSLLRPEALAALAEDVAPDAVDVELGAVMKLLVPAAHGALLCQLGAEPAEQRWAAASCRPLHIDAPARASLGLCAVEPGAAELVSVRGAGSGDGFFDASSGLRVWRPRYFDSQAIVRASGAALVVYGELAGDSARDIVEHFRLVSLTPGKTPRDRRLEVAPAARLLLTPDALLSWLSEAGDSRGVPTRDVLQAQALTGAEIGKAQKVGELPVGARRAARCTIGDRSVVLFTSGVKEKRYALLFGRGGTFSPPLDVGEIEGKVQLACQGNDAVLVRVLGSRATRWRCTPTACTGTDTEALPGLAGGIAAIAPVGDALALVWMRAGEPLRLRLAKPEVLHQTRDEVLLEDAAHGGVEIASFRMLSHDGVAVLLLRDGKKRLSALRIDASGKPAVVRVGD